MLHLENYDWVHLEDYECQLLCDLVQSRIVALSKDSYKSDPSSNESRSLNKLLAYLLARSRK